MVRTRDRYGMDVDVSISVFPHDDCRDRIFLAARVSASLGWNDARAFT